MDDESDRSGYEDGDVGPVAADADDERQPLQPVGLTHVLVIVSVADEILAITGAQFNLRAGDQCHHQRAHLQYQQVEFTYRTD